MTQKRVCGDLCSKPTTCYRDEAHTYKALIEVAMCSPMCHRHFVAGMFREGFTEGRLRERKDWKSVFLIKDRECGRWRRCWEGEGRRKCDQLPQAASGPGLLAVDPF